MPVVLDPLRTKTDVVLLLESKGRIVSESRPSMSSGHRDDAQLGQAV
jgi:hypothetical protein